MFTEKQIYKLTTINFIHEGLFEWVHTHTVTIPYSKLTESQRKTLLLIADMPKEEQKNYVIIDDILVETPTKVNNYTIVQGEWRKRKIIRVNKKADLDK